MIELADLRIFARIAEAGSISAAARALGLPKSSVSRSLVRIETVLGTTLVERSSGTLTGAGVLLRRHSQRILDDVAEAQDAVADFVGVPRGTLRVSAPPLVRLGAAGPDAAGVSRALPRSTRDSGLR